MRAVMCLLLLAPAMARAEVPKVATDIAPVHALVAQVMQGVGVPSLVIPAGASPHGFAMGPSEARNLSSADLVVWIGHELTPWLEDPLEALAPNAQKLALMDALGIMTLGFREGEAFGAHNNDAHGHDTHDRDEVGHDAHAQDEDMQDGHG